jgi:hypothetical protein
MATALKGTDVKDDPEPLVSDAPRPGVDVVLPVRPSPAHWVLLAGAWLLVSAGIVLWLKDTPDVALRDQLRRWQFWSLETQFVLLVALSWRCAPPLLRSLGLRARDLLFPAAVALFAFLLVTFVVPRTNRIYYDEHIYQSVGQNLADLHLAQMCNDGTVEYGSLQCWRGEYNKEPDGYPYLLSLAYRVAGVHEGVAFALNTVFAALTVLVVFLLTTALTDSRVAGLGAAMVAALIPEHLRWSHTAAAEPSAALACAVAVLAAMAFVRLRSTPALLWAAVASAFAAQVRPECLLVVPLAAAIVMMQAPRELARPRFWWIGLAGLVLLAAHAGHLAAVRHESWGASGPRLSTAYFATNLATNGWFFLWDARFPVVYSALALAALVSWRRNRLVVIPAFYFLLFWGIFLFFYAGSYNFGADDRFSLMTSVPVAVMAGIGASSVVRMLATRGWLPAMPATTLIAVALSVQFLWYMPFVRATGEEAWNARADVTFAREAAARLPGNAIVLTHNPTMFHVWGYNAAQVSLATSEASYVETVLRTRYAGGVFFHWNYWCDVADPLQQSFCTSVLERFPHTLVREYRERNYRFAIYRLDAPAAAQSTPR